MGGAETGVKSPSGKNITINHTQISEEMSAMTNITPLPAAAETNNDTSTVASSIANASTSVSEPVDGSQMESAVQNQENEILPTRRDLATMVNHEKIAASARGPTP